MNNLQAYLGKLKPEFLEQLSLIESISKKIKPKDGFVITEPSRTQTSTVTLENAKKLIDLQNLPQAQFEKMLFDNPELPLAIKASMYDRALTNNQFHQYVWTKENVLSECLEAISNCIAKGFLVHALVLVRSALEQIGDLYSLSEECKTLFNQNKSLEEEALRHNDFSEILFKKLLSTKIDWQVYLEGSLREGRKKSYKAVEGFTSSESESVLNSIDRLDKKIKGIRKAYEFLCEFAHPNAGSYLIYRSGKKKIKTNSAFTFIETTTSNQTPSDSIVGMSKPIFECFDLLTEACNEFQQATGVLNSARKILIKENEKSIETLLPNWIGIWSPDEPCPCLSNKSVGLCCGKKLFKRR
jgi:hypothetical protein